MSIMIEPLPQFGVARPGVAYPPRPGAHGIAADAQGRIAIVEIGAHKGPVQYDLPGGGIDAGESEAAAMAREFLEETGLIVEAGAPVYRAAQFWLKDGVEPRNSIFSILKARVTGAAGTIVEPDHTLVWLDPLEAIAKVRHPAHVWALCLHLASVLT
jgi:8-oxo-dGTP diphosphatase